MDGIIVSNKVAVIDMSFNIELTSLSDLINFKDITRGDYYLFNEEVSEDYFYEAATQINDDVYLVGYHIVEGNVKGFIKKNNDIIETESDLKNIDVEVINGNLLC